MRPAGVDLYGVGGSKRRGRNASNRHFAFQLVIAHLRSIIREQDTLGRMALHAFN